MSPGFNFVKLLNDALNYLTHWPCSTDLILARQATKTESLQSACDLQAD